MTIRLRAGSRARWIVGWLVLASTTSSFGGCGGLTEDDDYQEVSGSGGVGAMSSPGGTGATSGTDGGSGSDTGFGSGGFYIDTRPPPEGGASSDGCDEAALWEAVTEGIGSRNCIPVFSDPSVDTLIVLDSEGRIVENTGLLGEARKKAWLDRMSSQRWPCWAGQTIKYTCAFL